jgi:hypothetical protein
VSDVDGLRQQIAEALRLHGPLLLTGHVSCSCGWRSETSFHIELTTARHREHVAHVVEVLVTAHADRVARDRAAEELIQVAERLLNERDQVWVAARAAALADVARGHDAGHDGQQR